ncbi:MAG TPA: C-terminal helicase domain-containing protein, partial [Trebonia sp.]
EVLFLHGGVPKAARDEMVARFQAEDATSPPLFVLSLKAGGTGLTLTRATHVLHYDRWWNPAVEDQATDRAYRIGQDRPVQVHRLIAEGTLEDRIAALLEKKRDLADAVIGSGERWIADLSDGELSELVSLRAAS